MTTTALPAAGRPRGPVADAKRVGDPAPGHVGSGPAHDAALLAVIAAGDPAALDQLYIRYRSVAFAAAYAVLERPESAEDAVHDAFLSVWRAAGSFQPERASVRAWLLTIVRNAAIDRLRVRQLAQRSLTTLTHDETLARGDEDICATVALAAEVRRLRAALAALPHPQRNAIELAFLGGLSHGEIAARTGVPLGTIKGRIRLGLCRLRRELGVVSPRPCSAA